MYSPGLPASRLDKDGFLKEYLEGGQEGLKEETTSADQGQEVRVHGE